MPSPMSALEWLRCSAISSGCSWPGWHGWCGRGVLGGLELHPLSPAIGWLAALALVSQTAGWLLITSSLPRLPAAVSSLMLLLQPAASLALAAVILGQRPTVLQIVGAILTCGGALAASLSSTRRASDESTPAKEAEHAAAAE